MTLSCSVAATLRMTSGVAIWAIHFMAIFAFTTLACARELGDVEWLGIGVVTWVLGALSLAALAATLAVIAFTLRLRERGFVEWISASVAGLAALAIAWEALPVLLLPPCIKS